MDSTPSSDRGKNFRFGPFRLSLSERALWAGNDRLDIGSRAFDILALLASQPGEVISHKQFQESVWPDTVVEDGNLRVHIARIRKALGSVSADKDFIQSVAGLGYQFVGHVAFDDGVPVGSAFGTVEPATSNDDFDRALGRRGDINAVLSLVKTHALVTVTGPGGVGKTTVCAATLRAYGESNPDSTAFVDLSSVEQGHHVETAVASALNLNAIRTTPLDAVIDALKKHELLLALDCCEQVIEGVMTFVVAVIDACPGVRILTTSRQPLRLPGEQVFELAPLPVPEDAEASMPASARTFASVRLFIERATSADSRFDYSDADLPIIAGICRKMDGLPLAIELAASRVTAFSLKALADELDDRLSLLVNGRRTAAPRHQALRTTIDWSYRLLSEREQQMMCRLSIYRGAFTMSKVLAVNQMDAEDSALTAMIQALCEKSLLLPVEDPLQPSFRMLDSIRAFCLEKLVESAEYASIADMHLAYFTDVYTRPFPLDSTAQYLHPQAYNRRALDDVRGALRWALTRPGTKELDLFWASAPIFFMLGLVTEHRTWLDQAVRSQTVTTRDNADTRYRLLMALGLADFLTQNIHESEGPLASDQAYQITLQFPDTLREVTALAGVTVAGVIAGDYKRASRAVREFRQRVDKLPRQRPHYHNLTAIVAAQTGELAKALRNTGLAASTYRKLFAEDLPLEPSEYDTYHHNTLVQALESRILWQMGRFDDATVAARESVSFAVSLGKPLTLCFAIATGACPVACWSGDLAELKRLVGLLEQVATDMSLVLYKDQIRYGYALALRAGGFDDHADIPSEQMERLAPPTQELLGTISRHHLTPLAIKRALSGEAGAAAPEILRNLGENAAADGVTDITYAQELFRRSINLSQKNHSQAWELRATTSLARSLASSGGRTEACELLHAVVERQVQGLSFPDVVAARAVLDDIR